MIESFFISLFHSHFSYYLFEMLIAVIIIVVVVAAAAVVILVGRLHFYFSLHTTAHHKAMPMLFSCVTAADFKANALIFLNPLIPHPMFLSLYK